MSELIWVEVADPGADRIRVPQHNARICATSSPSGYTCTRRAGHGGRHLATNMGDEVCAVWSQARVHNHQPWRPMCSERRLPDGQLRGACLTDGGSDR